MNQIINCLSRIFAFLTVLYPYGFRQEFASEMQVVFQKKLISKSKIGMWALWRDIWKELGGLPIAILTEYWFAFREPFGKRSMFLITENKSWRIKNRRDAIIASLPPVMV